MVKHYELRKESNNKYEIIIIKYPDNRIRKKNTSKRKENGKISATEIVQKNTLIDIFKKLNYFTEMCVSIFVNKFGLDEKSIRNGDNIYCPLHENKNTSRSPSAKFNVKFNTYVCFSTKCPIRKKITSGRINSIVLFDNYLKEIKGT